MMDYTKLPFDEDTLDEEGFTPALRSLYDVRSSKGALVMSIHSDVVKVFPNAGVVNKALRFLITIGRKSIPSEVLQAVEAKNAADYAEAAKFDDDDMREEYDFSQGVRGKYAGYTFDPGMVMMKIASDVVAVFPDPAAVNAALRMLISVARKSMLQEDE